MVSVMDVGVGLPGLHFHPPERHDWDGLGDSRKPQLQRTQLAALTWVVAQMSRSGVCGDGCRLAAPPHLLRRGAAGGGVQG